MAVVKYKCDTCERDISILQNQYGLEIINTCIITDNCHGSLSQIDIKIDHIRGDFPSRISGLDDYVQRKSLYNHTQSIKLTEWVIPHSLGVNPFIQVYISKPTNDNPDAIVETLDITVVLVSEHILKIIFEKPESGIAQLISKNTSTIDTIVDSGSTTDVSYTQTTTGSILSIGTLNSKFDPSLDVSLELTFIQPDGSLDIKAFVVSNNIDINSPWSDYDTIYTTKSYTVRSVTIPTITKGSSFYISSINGILPVKNDILLLLANQPYKTSDKIIDRYLDIYDIIATNSIDNTLYNNDELYVNDSKVIIIYPAISKVT